MLVDGLPSTVTPYGLPQGSVPRCVNAKIASGVPEDISGWIDETARAETSQTLPIPTAAANVVETDFLSRISTFPLSLL